ncbi:MAG: hypothetical protein FWD90_06310 [Defluviitaleaceae bacterium]|nr:hypothetical protein [Defluviitaleaceae bacterium]
MKINAEKLLDYIGRVGDDLVLESETATLNTGRSKYWGQRWTSMAAVFVLAAVIAGLYFLLPSEERYGVGNQMMFNDSAAPMAAESVPMATPVPAPDAPPTAAAQEDNQLWGSNDAGGIPIEQARIGGGAEIEAVPSPFLIDTPFVLEEGGSLVVYGFGGRIEFHTRGITQAMPRIYFEGHFPIDQLEDEFIHGWVSTTRDSMEISFVVVMNELIMDRTDGPLGMPAGPIVEFVYTEGAGITDMTLHPFEFIEFDNDTTGTDYEPLEFDFAEENALAFAQLIRKAERLVDDYLNP